VTIGLFREKKKMEHTTPRSIKMGAERAIIYSMIMDVVRRCDAAYGKYQRKGSSIGATLETYMIVAAVLIGEMEGRLFTAQKLAAFLGFARGTVQRKLDHLMKVKAVERVSKAQYRLGEISLQETAHVTGMINVVHAACAALSKLDKKEVGNG
jgi:hypothetical protein